MKKVNEIVKNIIGSINYLNWKVCSLWVENNCIYCERIRVNGVKEIENLYKPAGPDAADIYKVFNKLKYVMNFNNMLNDDNVLI